MADPARTGRWTGSPGPSCATGWPPRAPACGGWGCRPATGWWPSPATRRESVVACLAATGIGATWSSTTPDLGTEAISTASASGSEPVLLLAHTDYPYQGVRRSVAERVEGSGRGLALAAPAWCSWRRARLPRTWPCPSAASTRSPARRFGLAAAAVQPPAVRPVVGNHRRAQMQSCTAWAGPCWSTSRSTGLHSGSGPFGPPLFHLLHRLDDVELAAHHADLRDPPRPL